MTMIMMRTDAGGRTLSTVSSAIAPSTNQVPAMSIATPIVFVVDDDVSVRESLQGLIAGAGLHPEVFASAEEFLARPRGSGGLAAWCSTWSLPDLNGLELQKRYCRLASPLPIIFITGRGDIPMSVEAMKGGAVEFLTKPFLVQEILLSAIQGAIERSRALLTQEGGSQSAALYATNP